MARAGPPESDHMCHLAERAEPDPKRRSVVLPMKLDGRSLFVEAI